MNKELLASVRYAAVSHTVSTAQEKTYPNTKESMVLELHGIT